MKLFDALFGKGVIIDHDFFGKMTFHRNKKHPDKSFFECSRIFAPSGELMDMSVVAEESGPTQEQVDFIKALENQYPSIADTVTRMIIPEYQKWQKETDSGHFDITITPAFMWLSDCRQKPVAWEIGFELARGEAGVFNFTMSDFHVVSMKDF